MYVCGWGVGAQHAGVGVAVGTHVCGWVSLDETCFE